MNNMPDFESNNLENNSKNVPKNNLDETSTGFYLNSDVSYGETKTVALSRAGMGMMQKKKEKSATDSSKDKPDPTSICKATKVTSDTVWCPKCDTSFEIMPDYFGMEAECSECGLDFIIPYPDNNNNKFLNTEAKNTSNTKKSQEGVKPSQEKNCKNFTVPSKTSITKTTDSKNLSSSKAKQDNKKNKYSSKTNIKNSLNKNKYDSNKKILSAKKQKSKSSVLVNSLPKSIKGKISNKENIEKCVVSDFSSGVFMSVVPLIVFAAVAIAVQMVPALEDYGFLIIAGTGVLLIAVNVIVGMACRKPDCVILTDKNVHYQIRAKYNVEER